MRDGEGIQLAEELIGVQGGDGQRLADRLLRSAEPRSMGEEFRLDPFGEEKPPTAFLPIGDVLYSRGKQAEVDKLYQGYVEGTLAPDQEARVESILDYQDRPQTALGMASGMTGEAIPWMAEYALTSGALSVLGKAVTGLGRLAKGASWAEKAAAARKARQAAAAAARAGERGAAVSLAQRAKDAGVAMGRATAQMAVSEALRAPAGASRIWARAEEMAFQRNFTDPATGRGPHKDGTEYVVKMAADRREASDFVLAAGLDTYIEWLSEGLGENVLRMPWGQKVAAFQQSAFQALVGKEGYEKAVKVLRTLGFNGVLRELGEEWTAEGLREAAGRATGLEGLEGHIPSLKENLAMFASFLAIGGGVGVTSALVAPQEQGEAAQAAPQGGDEPPFAQGQPSPLGAASEGPLGGEGAPLEQAGPAQLGPKTAGRAGALTTVSEPEPAGPAAPSSVPRGTPPEAAVIAFEDYSAQQGVPSKPPSFAGYHIATGGVSKPAKKAATERIQAGLSEWQERRTEVRAEYDRLVEAGEVRPPTRTEELQTIAQGEGEAAEAAKRLLKKHAARRDALPTPEAAPTAPESPQAAPEAPEPQEAVEVSGKPYRALSEEELAPSDRVQRAIAERVSSRPVKFVGPEAPFRGVTLDDGTVVLRTGESAVTHELVHRISQTDPTGKRGGEDIRGLHAQIKEADAQGLRIARRQIRSDYIAAEQAKGKSAEEAAEAWRRYSARLKAEEGLAGYAERDDVVAYLRLLGTEAGRKHVARIARANRPLLQRIYDAVRGLLAKLTGGTYTREELDPRPARAAQAIFAAMEKLREREGVEVKEGGERFGPGWHGSAAEFDEFSDEFIGSGEGAQAYGYGHYFAGKREVAEYYRNVEARKRVDATEDGYRVRGDATVYKAFDEAWEAAKGKRLYKVDLAPQEDEYLLWDEPLSAQSEKVKAALEGVAPWPEATEPEFSPEENFWEPGELNDGGMFYGDVARRLGSDRAASQALLSAGIRGIKYRDATSRGKEGEGSYNYVVFDPKDIKIEERFAKPGQRPRISDILPAKARKILEDQERALAEQAVPAETAWTTFVSATTDKAFAIKDLEEELKRRNVILHPDEAPYAKAIVSPAKIRETIRRWIAKYQRPMYRALRQNDISPEDAGMFLVVRHARERTQWLIEDSQANPEKYDREFDHGENNGAGIPSDEADKLRDEYLSKPGYREYGQLWDQFMTDALAFRRDAGLISQEAYDALTARWEHYAPLQNAESATDRHFPARPRGFQVRGPEWKRVKGRRSLPDNPLIIGQSQAFAAVERAVHNDVARAIHGLLEQHKAKITSETTESPAPGWEPPRDKFTYKQDGREVVVHIPGNESLARAIKNQGAPHTPLLLRHIGKVTRTLAALYTSFSPEFILLNNPRRDLAAAWVNLGALYDPKRPVNPRDVGKKLVPAVRATWRGLRDKAPLGKAGEMFEESSQAGLLASGPIVQKEYDIAKKALERELRAGELGQAWRGFVEGVEDTANTVENAIRLATYWAFRDAGYTVTEATMAGKEVTLNFDRRGYLTSSAGNLYAFLNAGTQGARQLLKYGLGMHLEQGRPKITPNYVVMRRLATLTALAILTVYMNYFMGGDDEDDVPRQDRVPDYVKRSNAILLTPNGGQLSTPLPWGYGAAWALGVGIGEMLYAKTSGNEHGMSVGNAAMMVVESALEGLSPINPAPPLQMLSPTALTPWTQVETNQTFWGGPLMPGKDFYGREIPDSERSWKSTPGPFKWIARTLNRATGGDEFEEGKVSVSPESLEVWWDAYTGGIGRLLKDAYKLSTVGYKPSHTPFLRRVYREASEQGLVSDYYDAVDVMKSVTARRRAEKLRDEDAPFARVESKLTRLARRVREAEKGSQREREAMAAYLKLYREGTR